MIWYILCFILGFMFGAFIHERWWRHDHPEEWGREEESK